MYAKIEVHPLVFEYVAIFDKLCRETHNQQGSVDDGWERVWQNVAICPFRGNHVGTGCTVLDES